MLLLCLGGEIHVPHGIIETTVMSQSLRFNTVTASTFYVLKTDFFEPSAASE